MSTIKLLRVGNTIYATTASLPNEPSYTCYFDKDLGTDVGDVYSVYWMENTELATKDTTLQEQFAYTKKKTTTSHVMQYGDLSIAKLPISQFLGSKKSSMSLAGAELTRTVNNKDFPLVMAQQSGDYHKLSELSTGRQFLDTVFEEYVNSIQHLMNANNDVFNTRLELNNRECYHNFVDTFNDQCLSITQHSYALNKLYTFVNICEQMDDSSATQALNQLVQYCQQNLPNGYPTNIL